MIIAHNKDDFVETIIYRMIKGAGADVYNCLKKKNNYILRPILNFYREEIKNYAKKKIIWNIERTLQIKKINMQEIK